MQKRITLLVFLMAAFSSFCFSDNVALCYHKFGYSISDIYSVLPEVLEWQLSYIKKQGIPVTNMEGLENILCQEKEAENPSVLLTVDDGWKSSKNILPILARQQVTAMFFLYPIVIHKDVKKYLTPSDLHNVMKSPWVEFGCHSYSHPVLSKIDDKQLYHEVVDSKQRLEQWLGTTLNVMAYPYGMANKRVRDFCRKHYEYGFTASDGVNNFSTDHFDLKRFIIYRNTTFGEFKDIISRANGKKEAKEYKLVKIGRNDDYGKYGIFPDNKYYRFPPGKTAEAPEVIFIPSSGLGPGWLYMTIKKAVAGNMACGVMVNRNNNIPFYRGEKDIYKAAKNWGLPAYMEDLKEGLDFAMKGGKKAVIVTWGDGFDVLISLLSQPGDDFSSRIKGIIAINPMLPKGDNGDDFYRRNHEELLKQIADGKYISSGPQDFLEFKTLSDLAYLKPKSASPFAARYEYGDKISNKELLASVLNSSSNPDMALDYKSAYFTDGSFWKAFMQPLPLFPQVIPTALLDDINMLELNNFKLESAGVPGPVKLSMPVSYAYTDNYAASVKKARELFPGTGIAAEYKAGPVKTMEAMLSSGVSDFILRTAGEMMNEGQFKIQN